MSISPDRPVAVVGATGRLGSALLRACAEAGVTVTTTANSSGWRRDSVRPGVVIDASRPVALDEVADYCRETGAALLSCVSGRPAAAEAALDALAARVPVLVAANLSPLHWLQAHAARLVARLAAEVVPDAEFAVIDRHPTTKLDAPSATARQLAALVGNDPPVVSDRFGPAVSDHEVLITAGGETLALTHSVRDLRGPATGALRLAARLEQLPPGRYTADEVYADLTGAAR
ncbi:dihydrodipicolinate reductase C-terminal domain-containing protein [Nocardia takedensis]